jgi:OOP family OmpA-OmpF porin
MKKLREVLAVTGLCAALGFAGSAAAQSNLSSWYVGGTVGQAEFKDACQGLASCDEKDTAWRILGGYQFNRNFAAEIGYHNLGEASAPGGAAEGTAWELVGIGTLPLGNQFSAYGKLGVYRGELEAFGAEETNNDLTFGVGLQYDFTRALGVRGEWQRYSNMGGGAVAETDVDVLNVGAVYRFQ